MLHNLLKRLVIVGNVLKVGPEIKPTTTGVWFK
jgi:hypothetical protein